MGILAIQVATGGRGEVDQRVQQIHLAGTLMKHTGGRWIVAVAGMIVVVVAAGMVYEGSKKQFLNLFGYLPTRLRDAVVWLGRVGTISRGVVFAVASALVVVAAWSANSTKVGGIDEALRILLREPYGSAVGVVLGAGLMLFGIYGLTQAKWQRVSDGVAT
jgi:hypothetical protein